MWYWYVGGIIVLYYLFKIWLTPSDLSWRRRISCGLGFHWYRDLGAKHIRKCWYCGEERVV